LGFVLPPLALLPTIQFGVGDTSICARAVRAANENPAAGIAPGALSHPRQGRPPATAQPPAPSIPHAAAGPATQKGTMKIDAARVHAIWQARQQQGQHVKP
jgi:hypothetical protein